jgi:hypothetical protein
MLCEACETMASNEHAHYQNEPGRSKVIPPTQAAKVGAHGANPLEIADRPRRFASEVFDPSSAAHRHPHKMAE